MNSSKPFKCIIRNWLIQDLNPELSLDPNIKKPFIIRGSQMDHPDFGYCWWFTSSQVITPRELCIEGAEIETLNSRYKLGEPRLEDEDDSDN